MKQVFSAINKNINYSFDYNIKLALASTTTISWMYKQHW